MADPPPKKGVMSSLYAEYLDPKPAEPTISAPPVMYPTPKKDESGAKATPNLEKAGLPFFQQTIKRPQAQKAKKKPGAFVPKNLPNAGTPAAAAGSPDNDESSSTAPKVSNLEYWRGDPEEDAYYAEVNKEKRQQENKRRKEAKKKKKNPYQDEPRARGPEWDKTYDLLNPTVHADYHGSEEQIREIDDWKARLYHKHKKGKRPADDSDDSHGAEPSATKRSIGLPGISFAPPKFDDAAALPLPAMLDDDDDDVLPYPADALPSAYPSNPVNVSNDATGNDAYARRSLMSGIPFQSRAQPALPASHDPAVSSLGSIRGTATAPTIAPGSEAAQKIAAEGKAKAMALAAKFTAQIQAKGKGTPLPADAPSAGHGQLPPPDASGKESASASSTTVNQQAPSNPSVDTAEHLVSASTSKVDQRFAHVPFAEAAEQQSPIPQHFDQQFAPASSFNPTEQPLAPAPVEQLLPPPPAHTPEKPIPASSSPPLTHAPQAYGGTISRSPVQYHIPGTTPSDGKDVLQGGPVISRAPVRYDVKAQGLGDDPKMEQAGMQEEAPQPAKPKKKNIGEQILMKSGWTKGQGLGARGEGITEAVRLQRDKRKDGPANLGRFTKPKRKKAEETEEDDDSLLPSEVVKAKGMLVGVDIDHEMVENNLMQQLADHFKVHGPVERVVIWREEQGGDNEVLIKFEKMVNGLKAVRSGDNRPFLGNPVEVAFFPAAKFENGEYA